MRHKQEAGLAIEADREPGCDFCNELNGENNSYWELADRYHLPRDRIIYENKNWAVWPTIGAIVPGYVMIVTKSHRLSLLDCSKEELLELEGLLSHTRDLLGKIYHLPCIAFEHGGVCGIANKPSCIDHCHLHVVPLAEDIYHKIDLEKFQVNKIETLMGLMNVKRGDPYLLYQNQKKEIFVLHADTYISQYFRQFIALSEKVPDKWDWRSNHFPENIKKTINDMGGLLYE